MFNILSFYDYLALLFFIACWVGFSCFSNHMINKKSGLSYTLTYYYRLWLNHVFYETSRVGDAQVVSIWERSAVFFASTSMLLLAGSLSILGSSDVLTTFLANLSPSLIDPHSLEKIQLKIVFLAGIFIYSFFSFTWAVRQFNFAALFVVSLETRNPKTHPLDEKFITQGVQLLTLAFKTFNYGLRSFYFGLAVLSWILGDFAFILMTITVVLILCRREFFSKTYKALLAAKAHLATE